MAKVKIGDKDFDLRYTIESWKKLKSEHDITPNNFDEKANADPANLISVVIFYGLSPKDRESISVDEIDASIDFSVMDVIKAAVREGLPQRGKEAMDNEEKGGESVPEKK